MAKGGDVIFGFKADDKEFLRSLGSIENKVGRTGTTIKGVLGGLGIAKLVGSAFNSINNSLDGAISRVDTMNNFPRVMSNLGISSNEARKSVETLSDKLTGLPTTLDSATSSVQRLTATNGDVNKSTKYFLALNNAILAGGASTEIQASAIEQLSQAYSKGKMDMMEWRSLQTAMPAQLKQVAMAMGMSTDALGEGLRNGTVSMETFMQTISKLNTEGVNGFASFEEQARGSTGGVATSIQNAKTAITRAVANIIYKLDEALKTWGGLSGVIQSFGKTAENVINSVSKYIVPMVQTFVKLKPAIVGVTIAIGSMYTAFKLMSIVKTITTSIQMFRLAIMTTQTTATLLGGSISTLRTALNLLNLGFLASPIFWIIAGIVALIAVFVLLWNKFEGFRNFWITAWEGIKSVFSTIVGFIKDNWKSLLLMLVNPFAGAFKLLYNNCTGFRNFINNFVSAVVGSIKSIPSKIASIPSKIKNIFKTLKSKMTTIGKNIIEGMINGIRNKAGALFNKVAEIGNKIKSKIKDALKIGSPSKVTYQYGAWTTEGFINGLDSLKKQLYGTFDDMFQLSPSLYGSTSNNLSPNINVINNIDMKQDPLGQMVKKVKTFSGGAKNDYNYGSYGG